MHRDDFATRAFPEDVYGLYPAAFADIGPRTHEAGITWGAAKAWVHKSRHSAAAGGSSAPAPSAPAVSAGNATAPAASASDAPAAASPAAAVSPATPPDPGDALVAVVAYIPDLMDRSRVQRGHPARVVRT